MGDKTTTIQQLKDKINKFSIDRGWKEFENPKNIVMVLSVETAELVEIFQWLHSDEVDIIKKDEKEFEHLKEEIADVFWYLIRICKYYDIDLANAVFEKEIKNAKKYPIS